MRRKNKPQLNYTFRVMCISRIQVNMDFMHNDVIKESVELIKMVSR